MINDWLARVKKYCPKKILKRRSGINIGLQKVIYSGVNAFLLSDDAGEGSADEGSEDDQEYEYDNEDLIIPNHVCLPDFKELMVGPESFRVDLSEELDRLQEVCAVCCIGSF